jgi:sterol desaturase/sphingolipid hydroxylase (fatty acid hydroxylase superfamily)
MKTQEIKQTYIPKVSGKKTVFTSQFGEFFTHTHPYVAISLFIVIGLSLSLYALLNDRISTFELSLFYPLGLFSFTLVEYVVHRYVFHMAITTKIKEKIQYGAHGVHHEYPNDQGRLVMPPVLSIPLSSILFYSAYLIFGNWAFAFMGGFFTGYGLYLFVHYIVHAWKMPKNSFKTLWLYHNIHHFQNENVAYGVTSHFWDRVFGTMPEFQAGKTKK